MTPSPPYSLIICTRDRAAQLSACLDRLPVEGLSAHGVELILVNNGSHDETSRIIARFAAAHPTLQLVTIDEPDPGLSRARNSGLRRARGEMVVFTDDDCYLDPDYFDQLRDAAGSREFDYFGGNILLFRDGDGEEGGYLNRSDTASIAAGTIPAPGEIQGANMGFRRAMLGVIGYFNPLLGAGTPFRFEDIDYVARASLAGFRGAHLPSVQVRHDHRRVRGSPELQAIYRSNCRASGAYFLNVALLDRRRGLAAWRRHWRGLLDGAERNRERLKLEAAGAGAYLLYLARHGSLPKLKY